MKLYHIIMMVGIMWLVAITVGGSFIYMLWRMFS